MSNMAQGRRKFLKRTPDSSTNPPAEGSGGEQREQPHGRRGRRVGLAPGAHGLKPLEPTVCTLPCVYVEDLLLLPPSRPAVSVALRPACLLLLTRRAVQEWGSLVSERPFSPRVKGSFCLI